MMDSACLDGASETPADRQEGRGQAALEEEDEETPTREIVDGDPSEGDDDDDDAADEVDDDSDDQSKQKSTKDDSTTTLGANKSSSLGNSNKRQRHHHHHHHHQRDNYTVKDSDKLIVEWDGLADGPLGDVPLTRNIPFIERDNLLGWATHITQATRDDTDLFDPLAGLANVPLPPSMLFLLHEAAGEHLVAENDKKHEKKPIFECFDQSALVALGMVLEEAITSSLMPLARAHVARCRRLEEEASNVPTRACREFPTYMEWTLPPAEAVAKLQVYNNSATSACKRIETALPSTRSPDRNALPDGTLEEESSTGQMPLDEQEHQDALDRWCKAHGLEVDFVLKNMDIFGSLVSTKCQPR